jgi:hypothetical protein
MGPKIRREKRRVAATTVQCYMRGYLSHKHSLKLRAETKIEQTALFFNQIRKDIQLKAIVLI